MKMRNFILTAAFGTFAVSSAAYAVSTEEFVKNASISNEFEIETSKLALDKSQNKDVKRFAQHMVDDHNQSSHKLETVLESSKTGLRSENQLDKKHQMIMDKLQNLSKDDFNNEYISAQTDAHKVEAVDLFSSYSKHGDDPQLKNFATSTLPVLQEHLKSVKELKSDYHKDKDL